MKQTIKLTLLYLLSVVSQSFSPIVAQENVIATYDLSFDTPLINNGQFCTNILIKAAEGAPDFAIAAHTIWIKYNYNCIQLNQETAYSSINFNETSECVIVDGVFSQYPFDTPAFGADNTTGDCNITTLTANGQAEGYECPIVNSSDFIAMGTLCFDIIDATQTTQLSFDPNFSIINLSDNTPEHLQGSFGILDVNPTTEDVVIPNDEPNSMVDGYVVWDINGNMTHDADEMGIEAVTVVLINLENGDDVTSMSDENGYFSFEQIPPTTYVLSVEFGEMTTTPTEHTLELLQNDTLSFFFGFVNNIIPPNDSLASITGLAWLDENENGVQDFNEQGLTGVLVDLYDADDVMVANTYTDMGGYYGFYGIELGSYYVVFSAPLDNNGEPLEPTLTNIGNDALDSDLDPSTGASPTFSVAAGEMYTSIDAGFLPNPNSCSISIDNISFANGECSETIATLNLSYNNIAPESLLSIVAGSPFNAVETTLSLDGSGSLNYDFMVDMPTFMVDDMVFADILVEVLLVNNPTCSDDALFPLPIINETESFLNLVDIGLGNCNSSNNTYNLWVGLHYAYGMTDTISLQNQTFILNGSGEQNFLLENLTIGDTTNTTIYVYTLTDNATDCTNDTSDNWYNISACSCSESTTFDFNLPQTYICSNQWNFYMGEPIFPTNLQQIEVIDAEEETNTTGVPAYFNSIILSTDYNLSSIDSSAIASMLTYYPNLGMGFGVYEAYNIPPVNTELYVYLYAGTATSPFNENQSCSSLSQAYGPYIMLDAIHFNALDIVTNDDGSITHNFVIAGGLPSYDANEYYNFYINEMPYDADINIGHGDTINFTLPNDGMWMLEVSDALGCNEVYFNGLVIIDDPYYGGPVYLPIDYPLPEANDSIITLPDEFDLIDFDIAVGSSANGFGNNQDPCNENPNDVIICVEPMQTVTICPEFPCLDNGTYAIIDADVIFNCGLNIVDSTCVSYTPVPMFEGGDLLEVIACNNEGNCDTTFVNIYVSIDCAEPNNPPTAFDDNATVVQGQSVSIIVLNNDSDPEDDPITISTYTEPAYGTVSLVNEVFEYTASDPIYTGIDFFDYQICDNNSNCDYATVVIEILPDNCNNIAVICAEPISPLVLCPDFCGLPSNESYSIVTATTTYNCSIHLISDTPHCIEYTALPLFVGEEIITLVACTNFGVCDTSFIVVNVTPDCSTFDLSSSNAAVGRLLGTGAVKHNLGVKPDYAAEPLAWNSISPIPSTNTVSIAYSSLYPQNLQLEIYNLLGKQLDLISLTALEGSNKYDLKVNNYASGIYLLTLRSSTESITYKIVKE